MTMPSAEFLCAYARHRAAEGRTLGAEALRALPYLTKGPMARQWQVRARSFDAFLTHVVAPREKGTPLDILDLGAGNGWLSYRMARRGHRATALDIRDDDVDGLGAAAELTLEAPFTRMLASFEALPFDGPMFDIVAFNAALHYAHDLAATLAQARRVIRPGGVLAILDSPFYRREADGMAMVAEKKALGAARFGDGAGILLSQAFIEFLTPERLRAAAPGFAWYRHRVLYPPWYEVRPVMAALKRARKPSRFDLWTAIKP